MILCVAPVESPRRQATLFVASDASGDDASGRNLTLTSPIDVYSTCTLFRRPEAGASIVRPVVGMLSATAHPPAFSGTRMNG